MRLLAVLFTLPALLAQHLIHEYSHVVAAKRMGFKVLRIQWLTYHGGTKVFFEGEPDFDHPKEPLDTRWAWVSIAGFLVTNVIGYLSVAVFSVLENGWVKAAVCYWGIVFLSVDSLYFLLGSVFDFGDIVGFRKTLRISKGLSVLTAFLVFLLNLFLINRLWQ